MYLGHGGETLDGKGASAMVRIAILDCIAALGTPPSRAARRPTPDG